MGIDLSIKISGLKLKNPVMVASGTFGYGDELSGVVNLKKLGAIVTKTITLNPRKGNPPPRTCETACGLLNSIGLENPGLDVFIKEKLPFLKRLGVPVIVSIGSEGANDEFVKLAKVLDKTTGVDALEMNISCPNIQHIAYSIERIEKKNKNYPLSAIRYPLISQDQDATYRAVKAVRRVTKKTLIVKLSPNVTDIVSIARSAERAGADSVSLINTIVAMAIDIQTRKPKLGAITGGLSGPCIKPIALRMVYEVAQNIKIPVIGIGGITTADDALEFFIAGASAVQVGSANFINPSACIEIINGVKLYLTKNRARSVHNLIWSLGGKNMKNCLLFAVISFTLLSVTAFGESIETDSKITQAVVYQDSAMITRTADIKLSDTGEHTVRFKDIIPDIDENSLRVKGEGTASVKLFGASVKKEFVEKPESPRVREIQDEIQALQDEAQNLKNIKSALMDEKNFLDSVRLFSKDQIPKDLVTKIPSVTDLDNTMKFLGDKLKDNLAKGFEVDIKLRQIDKKIDVLRKELSQLQGAPNLVKRSILVDIGVEKQGSLNLEVSYLVRGVNWYPLYEARASFDKGAVELGAYGIVRQNTGEEWAEVGLSLSTAKPSISGRMPYVNPWVLRPYQPPVLPAVKRADFLGGIAMKAEAPLSQFEAYAPAIEEKPKAAEVIYTQAEERGVSVIYKVSRRATIKPDGSEQKLPISSQTPKANFEYSTYPRMSPFAYLGSRVTNSKDLQLLAGRVNVFLDGDFVGVSSIDNIGPSEEFDLYLGIDENVKVKREQIEKKIDDVILAGIPSPNRRTTFKYKTTLENYKTKKVKVIFFEAMPVSENERIKVKLQEPSLEPKEKDWKDRKGVWRWEIELEPSQKKEITYGFSVEHPRTMNVEGI